MKTRVSFSNNLNTDFFEDVRNRVNEYFKNNNISRFGNYKMVLKTIVMIALYMIPYIVLISGEINNPWLIWVLWMIMGFGMAGIGLAIMHDANHGSYSKNTKVNKALGYLINLVGGSVTNWKIQHNVLHHSYTNVEGHDEDITSISLLRFTPSQRLYKVHKFQYIYAWFFYSLMTFFWFIYKDIPQLMRYKKDGRLDSKQKKRYGWLLTELIGSKILYALYIIIVPIMVLDIPWWATILAFLTMQVICGLLLTTIFQLAHIMPSSQFPLPNEKGSLENSWAIHQLLTTTNFAPRSR
ncbi:MAG TPA: fatty acid desaturase, partial [Bacteroidales bacterium]|nr:fatty acid desaturase [Bacteroidales bacterium]